MFIYREADQQVQREAFVKRNDANGLPQGGWISERTMQKKERAAKMKPGRRVKIDKSGGLLQSVEWMED